MILVFLFGWIIFAYVGAYVMYYGFLLLGLALELLFCFIAVLIAAAFRGLGELLIYTAWALGHLARFSWHGTISAGRFSIEATRFVMILIEEWRTKLPEEQTIPAQPDLLFDFESLRQQLYDPALARAYFQLGLDQSCDEAAFRKAFRKKMRRAHPDVPGGSVEQAQRLNEAAALIREKLGW